MLFDYDARLVPISKEPFRENQVVKILKVWQGYLANFFKSKGYFILNEGNENVAKKYIWSNGVNLNVIDSDYLPFLQECLEQILSANEKQIKIYSECPIKIHGRNLIFAVIPKFVIGEHPYFRTMEMCAAVHGKDIDLHFKENPIAVSPLFNTELFGWNSRFDNDWGNVTYEDHHLFLHLLIHNHSYFKNYNSIK